MSKQKKAFRRSFRKSRWGKRKKEFEQRQAFKKEKRNLLNQSVLPGVGYNKDLLNLVVFHKAKPGWY